MTFAPGSLFGCPKVQAGNCQSSLSKSSHVAMRNCNYGNVKPICSWGKYIMWIMATVVFSSPSLDDNVAITLCAIRTGLYKVKLTAMLKVHDISLLKERATQG
jgi:hypothetical protein